MAERERQELASTARGPTGPGLHRLVLRSGVSAVLWPYLLAATAGWVLVGRARSLVEPREEAFQHVFRRWALMNMRVGGFRCRVEGGSAVPAPAIIVSNHQHFFDIQVLAAILPPPFRFVSRVEVQRVPLIGSVLRHGGHLLVARGTAMGNEATMRRATELLERGMRIVFFPEGTRSRDGRIGPLRPGAFRLAAATGVPVVPVVLAGTREAFPAGYAHIVPARMAASILPPLAVTEREAKDDAWRDALRQEMSEHLARLEPETGPRL